jgi:glycosyltransferase involved in cell wall biosynthesis
MKKSTLVSIIINNYNYADFLAEAINSALKQTYNSIEVIVVDDGSTDNSQTIIKSFNEQVKPIFKSNGGQASAFNAGFAASSGEVICFLDADDLFFPKKVSQIVNIFQDEPDIGWCFHDVQLVNKDGKEKLKNSPKNLSFKCDIRENLKLGKFSGTNNFFHIPPTSGLCFQRSLLSKILPMPEDITITSDSYVQHAALFLSPGFVLGEPLVLQRIHGNNFFTLSQKRQQTLGKIYILLSYWLKQNFPPLGKLTDKYIAQGLSLIWYYQIPDFNHQLLQDYLNSLTTLERLILRLRAIYYFASKIFNNITLNLNKTNA